MKKIIICGAIAITILACTKPKPDITPPSNAQKILGKWNLTSWKVTTTSSAFQQSIKPNPEFEFLKTDCCKINNNLVQTFRAYGDLVYITKEKLVQETTNRDSIFQDLYSLKLVNNDSEMEWESSNLSRDRPDITKIVYYFSRKK